MFQVFHLYVAKVYLGFFICCNNNIRMFQAYVQSASVVSDVCFKCFNLDVAYVAMAAHTCFECLFHVFKMFQTYVAKGDQNVAYIAMVMQACFRCFICFR
jgi:hypothetical protein